MQQKKKTKETCSLLLSKSNSNHSHVNNALVCVTEEALQVATLSTTSETAHRHSHHALIITES